MAISSRNAPSLCFSEDDYIRSTGVPTGLLAAQLVGSISDDPTEPTSSYFMADELARPSWLDPVIARLRELTCMEENWDSYRSVPLRPEVANFVLDLLSAIMRPSTPPPAIVPLPAGGVQLEWHTEAVELEISISVPGRAGVWLKDEDNPYGVEVDATYDFRFLRKPIERLSSRTRQSP